MSGNMHIGIRVISILAQLPALLESASQTESAEFLAGRHNNESYAEFGDACQQGQ
jgi:hypothetical protein